MLYQVAVLKINTIFYKPVGINGTLFVSHAVPAKDPETMTVQSLVGTVTAMGSMISGNAPIFCLAQHQKLP